MKWGVVLCREGGEGRKERGRERERERDEKGKREEERETKILFQTRGRRDEEERERERRGRRGGEVVIEEVVVMVCGGAPADIISIMAGSWLCLFLPMDIKLYC